MRISREELYNRKLDFSKYLVHFTRGVPNAPALDRLAKIVRERKIEARNPYFLCLKKLKRGEARRYRVVCFSETPLGNMQLLYQPVQGRKVRLQGYGLVFSKDYALSQGANPVFYSNPLLRDAFFNLWAWRNDLEEWLHESLARIFPFVTRIDQGMDFHWEREWHKVGNFKFSYEDIFMLVCPQERIDELRQRILDQAPKRLRAAAKRIPIIDPSWRPERILEELRGIH